MSDRVQLRHRFSGQVEDVSGDRIIHALETGLYEAVNPDAVVSTWRRGEGSAVTLDSTRVGDLVGTRRAAGGVGSFGVASPELAIDIRTQAGQEEARRAQRARQEELQSFGPAVGVVEAFSTMLAGGSLGLLDPAALAQTLRPETAGQYAELVAANEGWATAGQVTGMVAPLLVPVAGEAALAGQATANTARLASLGRFLRLSPSSEVVGNAVRAGTARLLGRLGMEEGGWAARAAGSVADNALQGAMFSSADYAHNSWVRDQPLMAEAWLANAGLDTVLGVGFDGVAAALGRGMRAIRRPVRDTPAAEMAMEVRGGEMLTAESIANMTEREVTDWAAARTIDQRPGFFSGLIGRGSGVQDERALMRLGSPELPKMVRLAENGLTEQVVRASNSFRSVDELEYAITGAGVSNARLNRYGDVFGAIDDGVLSQKLDAVFAGARDAVGSAAARQIVPGSRSARLLRKLEQTLDTAGDTFTTDPREVFEGALELQENLRQLAKEADTFGDGGEGVHEAVQTAIGTNIRQWQEFTDSAETWGRLGIDQAARDAGISRVLTARKHLEGLLDAPAGTSSTLAKRMDQTIRRAAKEPELMLDVTKAANEYLSAAREITEDFATRFGDEAGQLDRFRQVVNEARASWTNAFVLAENWNFFQTQLRRENLLAGAATAMGVTGIGLGAMLGTAIGGPEGGVLAGGAGIGGALAWAALTRPASFIARRMSMENMVRGFMQRRRTFQADFSKQLERGWRASGPSANRLAPLVVYGLTPDGQETITSNQDVEQAFTALVEQIDRLQLHPDNLIEELTVGTASLGTLDADLRDLTSTKAALAVSYLQGKLPPLTRDPLFPDQIASLPSRGEMEDFLRVYQALEDPYAIFERMITNLVTPAEVEAVQVVFPELYGAGVADVVEVLSSWKPGDIPYHARMALGTVLGIQTDPTLSTGFIVSMANNSAQTQAQETAMRGSGRRMPQSTQLHISLSQSDRLQDK